MAALPNEVGENVLETILNTNVSSSRGGDLKSNNSMLNHLTDLDTDDEFDDRHFFNNDDDQGHCKNILWTPIHAGTTVRTWDLLVLIPNLIFVIVLVTYFFVLYTFLNFNPKFIMHGILLSDSNYFVFPLFQVSKENVYLN